MFQRLTLRGRAGAILWGYRTVASVQSWTISKNKKGEWRLTAAVERADAYQLLQAPLFFSAPRNQGFWCWPIVSAVDLGDRQLMATLGQPEQ